MDKRMPQMNKMNKPDGRKKLIKNIGFLLILAIIAAVFFFGYRSPDNLTEKAYSDVIARANNGEIAKLEVQGEEIKVTVRGEDESTEKTRMQDGADLYDPEGTSSVGIFASHFS